jgi:hypothetical protein
MLAFYRKHAYNGLTMQTQHLLKVMSPGEVATALNIKVQAVYQWRKDREVPALRQYQLREYLTVHAPDKLARIEAASVPARTKRRTKPDTAQA